MDNLLDQLMVDYPQLRFEPSRTFFWSPKKGVIHYAEDQLTQPSAAWSLFHELSHALLGHRLFTSDFELLLMEVAAWDKAQLVAKEYQISIDPEHIQDCIDTYRDWLYQRSTCPSCTNSSLQIEPHSYQCHNCGTIWHVSGSRLCRPYRRKHKTTALKV